MEREWRIESSDKFISKCGGEDARQLIVTPHAGGCLITLVNVDGEFMRFAVGDQNEHQLNAAVFQAMRFMGPFNMEEK